MSPLSSASPSHIYGLSTHGADPRIPMKIRTNSGGQNAGRVTTIDFIEGRATHNCLRIFAMNDLTTRESGNDPRIWSDCWSRERTREMLLA